MKFYIRILLYLYTKFLILIIVLNISSRAQKHIFFQKGKNTIACCVAASIHETFLLTITHYFVMIFGFHKNVKIQHLR